MLGCVRTCERCTTSKNVTGKYFILLVIRTPPVSAGDGVMVVRGVWCVVCGMWCVVCTRLGTLPQPVSCTN